MKDQLLYQENEWSFLVTDRFESHMLGPVIRNLLDKSENDWDDYNEVYHCCRLIETVRRQAGMNMDFHYIRKSHRTVGIGLITHGLINTRMFFPDTFSLADHPQQILVFNYFHISKEGRGKGEYWLREIILPFYKHKGFAALYVKSSHPKVFSLYRRLGEEIGVYTAASDNNLFSRSGKIFRIPVEPRTSLPKPL